MIFDGNWEEDMMYAMLSAEAYGSVYDNVSKNDDYIEDNLDYVLHSIEERNATLNHYYDYDDLY